MLNIKLFIFLIFYFYYVLKSKEKSICYFFYLEKVIYSGFFYLVKSLLYKSWKNEKTNNLNFKNKLFSVKRQKKRTLL